MVVVSFIGISVSLCLLHCVVGETECPLGFYTSANATTPCSQCWPFAYCSNDGQAAIDLSLMLTKLNTSENLSSSFFIGDVVFNVDRSKGVISNHLPYRQMPKNSSELDGFYCSDSNRHGYFCSYCHEGCGIATYIYYSLPCVCNCHEYYGIGLYLSLEIGFSTLFFIVVFYFKLSVYSSRSATLICYCQFTAHIVATNPSIYTISSLDLGHYVIITFLTVHGFWNMDFFRHVVPAFCVSRHQSILSAISSGYISAVWPLFLIIMISLAMELHKRNFKAVVHTWKLINRLSSGAIQRRFAETNLIHTFASFFLLSYFRTIYVSSALLGAITPSHLNTENGTFSPSTLLSIDPQIHYFSRDHLVYAVPAILIILVIGVLIPLVMIIYPTRVGTWVGNRWRTGRIRNASKTFIEAFQGCYKDGTNGDRDYRAVPALCLFVRLILGTIYPFRIDSSVSHLKTLCMVFLTMSIIMAAFYGLAKPYKAKHHNCYDVMLYSLMAVLTVMLYFIFSLQAHSSFLVQIFAVLSFLPVTMVVPFRLILLLRARCGTRQL